MARAWAMRPSLSSIGFGGPTGLDYSGVRVVARMRGIPLDGDTFSLLQRLEVARLNAWTKDAKEKETAAKMPGNIGMKSRG